MNSLAIFVIVTALVALLALLVLHVVSPEFKPSWRMISEYAMGSHKAWITLFFFSWGLSSISLTLLCFQLAASAWLKLGAVFLLVNGIGALMGGLFDVRHKLHGLSFTLGVPTLIAAALFISYQLAALEGWKVYRAVLLYSAHATWISCVLMGVAMVVMISGFKKAGIAMGPDVEPPKEVPAGVTALAGYANRLLVLCYVGWNIVVAYVYLKLN